MCDAVCAVTDFRAHTETEIRTGKPSDLPRNVSEEQAMANPDVQKAVTEHLAELVRAR